ncbi:hypothetical protein D3C84_1094910 [compost metagenome]
MNEGACDHVNFLRTRLRIVLDCFDGRPEDGLYVGIGEIPAHSVAVVSIDVVCLAVAARPLHSCAVD